MIKLSMSNVTTLGYENMLRKLLILLTLNLESLLVAFDFVFMLSKRIFFVYEKWNH